MAQCNAVGGINLWPRVVWLDVFSLSQTYSQTPKEIESARRARMITVEVLAPDRANLCDVAKGKGVT